MIFTGQAQLQEHVKGRKHREKVAASGGAAAREGLSKPKAKAARGAHRSDMICKRARPDGAR